MLRLRELADHAMDLVLDARKQAARILSSARLESEALRIQAEQAGYQVGFDRGRQEGFVEGQVRARQVLLGGLIAGDEDTGCYEPVARQDVAAGREAPQAV
jgi:flagellar biosynthesis/type III secretory pathway protein FliH